MPEGKLNNKVSTSYSQYLTNTVNSFMFGKPVSYKSQNPTFMKRYNLIKMSYTEALKQIDAYDISN